MNYLQIKEIFWRDIYKSIWFNISYQLFEDIGFLLIAYNLLNNDYLDNSLRLCTENKEMIKVFISIFDYGWEKLKEGKIIYWK